MSGERQVVERDELTRVIRSVTDLWDEPLDEVHDVPQIVNALLAHSAAHDCATCEACLHDGHKCCGCHDGACCQQGGTP